MFKDDTILVQKNTGVVIIYVTTRFKGAAWDSFADISQIVWT